MGRNRRRIFGADLVVANLESPADFNRLYSPAPEVMLNDMWFNIDLITWEIFNGEVVGGVWTWYPSPTTIALIKE